MPKTILIVDDNDLVREMMGLLLQDWGYSAFGAADGLKGVQAAIDDAPDLILMDISMPELDGVSAVRRIKAVPERQNIPIICISAFADYYRHTALEAGCHEVISKPIDFEELRKIIDDLLMN